MKIISWNMTRIFDWNDTEAYSEPFNTSKIALFSEIENSQLYLDVWHGSEYASVMLYSPLIYVHDTFPII